MAYRHIKGGEAGREIYGDNFESLYKNARGRRAVILGFHSVFGRENRAVIFCRSGKDYFIALSSQ